jgi:outer membrane protein OmpA-like peptidoglycan-associated protein
MKHIFLPILCVALASNLFAQDTFRWRYGLGASIIFNDHAADFRALPNVPNCCPQFTEATGTGFGVAGLLEVPLSSVVFVGARLGYMDHSANFEATESTNLIVAGKSTPGSFTHSLNATVGSLGLEPRLGIRFFDAMTVSGGVRFGTMLSKTYEQQEVASVGTFIDSLNRDTKSAVRNQSSGDIPDATSLLMHAIFSIGYELPLNANATTLLVPEVSYALALNDVVKDLSWKANALMVGISIKFSPMPSPPKLIVYDTVFVRDTTRKVMSTFETPRIVFEGTTQEETTSETDVITKLTTIRESYVHEVPDPNMLAAKISPVGLDDEGNELPVATQHVEEFIQVHAHPLLSFVFFPTSSSTIPDRYEQIAKEQAPSYSLMKLFDRNDVEIHHSVLNIIGSRLQSKPNATITITGCNNDVGSEKNNIALSRARAEAIRNYLINSWSINASRIAVKVRNLPEVPSSVRSEDGLVENQRAEITSNDPEITDVFSATDTTRVPTPPQLRFRLKAAAAAPMIKWNLDVMQQGKIIKTFSGTGNPPDSIDWDLANDQKHVPRFNAPLDLKLTVTNDRGTELTSSATLPTEVRTLRQKQIERVADMKIDKFNLVLFDFAKADITPAHKRTLQQIESKLQPTSQIAIEGYTDRTGNSASNQKLALDRAASTAKELGRTDAKVVGIGDKRLLYPNDTPEGRFHCRTVQIVVKTPVQ